MSVKLLTEHHLEFLSLKGGCTGSSESTYHIVGNHMSRLICEKRYNTHINFLNIFTELQLNPKKEIEKK